MQICSQFIASYDGGVWADHIRVTGGSGGQVGVVLNRETYYGELALWQHTSVHNDQQDTQFNP